MALSRVLCPTLVGREAELSRLEDALLAALRGDGGVVIVGGEAGTGKTRLVTALADRARRLGCVVVSGGCSEAELALPYLPFLEAIGNHLATEDVSALRERLGSAADELAQLFPQMGRPAAPGVDAAQAKLRLFESILLLLKDAARSRALLVILEDLQWADPATRELLDYATRRLSTSNVLVFATYRTDELHRKHALLPTIQGWRRSGQAELIELKPLDPPAVAEMVRAIFEEETISDEFRDLLHERSEGNPFVLEEMLRDMLDRGDIFHTEVGWDRKALVEMRVPRSVTDALLHRLERLAREHVEVLSAASAVGRSFDLATLVAVTGRPEAAVLAALEAAVTFQLVEEDDRATGRYRFRHALTKEAVYEDMVVPRRQQLHSRIADVLKATPGAAPVDLANHLLLAGRYEEAVAMCVAAANHALEALAFHDAAELLQRAAPHVREPIERGRLLCGAGGAYWNNGESGDARAALEQGIADLESAGLLAEAATHRLLLGRCYWELMRTEAAREQFEKARDVLEAEGPSEALAIAYIRLSGISSFNEDLVSGLEDARRAVEIADRARADMAGAWAKNFLAIAEIGLGEVQAGFANLEASYQASLAGGHRFQVGNAVFNSVWIAIHVGAGERVAAWAPRVGGATFGERSWIPYIKASIALAQGSIVEAISLARTGVQKARDAGHQKQVWRGSVALAQALAENLRPDEAAAQLPPVSSRVEGQDLIYDSAARVRTRLAAGDVTGAFDDAMTVVPGACGLGSPADVVAEAATDAKWLRSFLEQLPTRGEILASPRLAVAHGRLALLEGRFGAAVELLSRADADFRRGGLLLDAWHVGRALAEAQFRSGDTAGAQRRLQAVISEAEGTGARLAARLARETAARLGIGVGAEAPPAEEAVARKVAAGERMVSVLFADVRGYTESSGRASPAGNLDRIATLQRWATQEVTRRHGIVDKFAGDAVMATFNVSGQSVDHAVQALRAAIAIIDKAGLAGLPVAAGIAVGPAVVGTLADSANVSVLGDVTNLAARLQAQSSAGEVTLSEEAWRRVEDWLADRGIPGVRVQLELKGFASPVTAYRLQTGIPALA